MTTTYAAYSTFQRTYNDRLEQSLERGPIRREIEYFLKNIGRVETGDQLIDNPRLYRFAMTAYDLESQIFAKGLVRKVLREGVADPKALANKLVDQKFKTFATAFGFAEVGSRNVRDPRFIETVVKRYTAVTLETNAGEENLAVRLGAYFSRQAERVTNWYAVLADKALREVVFTGLGLPDTYNILDPDRLVSILEKRMDVEDLQDPLKREKFILRFAAQYDLKNGFAGADVSRAALAAPINPNGGGRIISIDPSTLGAARAFA